MQKDLRNFPVHVEISSINAQPWSVVMRRTSYIVTMHKLNVANDQQL